MLDCGQARRASGCYTEFCDPPKSVIPWGTVAHFLQHAQIAKQGWSSWCAETCTSLKLNVCIIIDHSGRGHSFCDTGCTLSGWSKTVDMPLWWLNKSVTSEQGQHYSAPSDMIQIWGWQIKSRMLSGASSRGTPCFHWNYKLQPLQLPNTVGSALSFHSGKRASDRRSITLNIGKGTSDRPKLVP